MSPHKARVPGVKKILRIRCLASLLVAGAIERSAAFSVRIARAPDALRGDA